MTKEAGASLRRPQFSGGCEMRMRRIRADGAAKVLAWSGPVPDRIAGRSVKRWTRRAAAWRRAGEPFAVPDPDCPPAAPSEWRRVGSTVDPTDTIPGPFGQSLQRLGNAQNAFARLEGPRSRRLERGERAIFTAVIAAPTTLSSGLVLTSAFGQVELHVEWTEVPPTYFLLARRAGLAVAAASVDGTGLETWRLAMVARNDGPEAAAVEPSLHVACGIGSAGMSVGLYAGLLRVGFPAERPHSDPEANAGDG